MSGLIPGDLFRPDLVAHADWGSSPHKRQLALAHLQPDGSYLLRSPQPAGDPKELIPLLQQMTGSKGCLFLGFDFPIGLPLSYAKRVGVDDFLAQLPLFGQEEWRDFYRVAETLEEIHLHRPFYPLRPGDAKQAHLLKGLNLDHIDDLRRLCEKRVPARSGKPGRRAASPLFWTMGGQQVGKAAILGWQAVLAPAVQKAKINTGARDFGIWPFSGKLSELLAPGRVVIAETYPAECYTHLGIAFSPHRRGSKSGKRVQAERRNNADTLFAWAQSSGVTLAQDLQEDITSGFGPSADGEDSFDAAIGLMGMLNVLLGKQPPGEPEDDEIRQIEGWILGMDLCYD